MMSMLLITKTITGSNLHSAPPASVPRLVWQSKVRAKQADATARIASWSRDGALRNTVGERE
jgi:hypothetical protein